MKTKRSYSYAIAAFCAIWLQAGCVRQSVPPCLSDVQVSFRYVQNMSGADLFAGQVHKLTLLVFDAQDVYVGAFTDQGAALAVEGYAMHVSLEPGSYTLLAWGGWMGTYDMPVLEPGVSTLADFRLRANGRAARSWEMIDIPELDELFHGMYASLDVQPLQTAYAAIDLVKDTPTVWFTVTGLQYLSGYTPVDSDLSPFDVEIRGDNGLYGADNLPRRQELTLRYLPMHNADGDYTLDSRTRVLRLMLGGDIHMEITHRPSGKVIWEDNVIDMITANPLYATQQGIDRQDLFHFEYRLDADLNVTVSVNGWTIVNAIPLI